MTQQQPTLPFEDGTRRRKKTLNSIPFVDSQPQTLRLDNIGYLSYIRLQVYLEVTATAATAYTGMALIELARAFLPRVVLSTNTQSNIVVCSAYGLDLVSLLSLPGNYQSSANSDEKLLAPAGAGITLVWFEVLVPVALNDGSNYTLGLLNLQNDDVSADLRLEWANAKSLYATPANISGVTGYAVPELVYFDVPDPATYFQPPMDVLSTITETWDSIVIGTGEHVYPIPRGNIQVQTIHQLVDNNVAVTYASPINTAGKLVTHELRMQGSTTDTKSAAYLMAHDARRMYGRDLPAGVVVIDNLWDVGRPGVYELALQMLDSAQFTKLDSVFAVQGMGAATSKLRTIRREIVRLEQ